MLYLQKASFSSFFRDNSSKQMRLFCHWYADGKERLFLQSNPLQQDFFVNYPPFHPFLRHRHPFFFRTFWPALIPMPVIFLFSPQTLSCRPDAASFFFCNLQENANRENLFCEILSVSVQQASDFHVLRRWWYFIFLLQNRRNRLGHPCPLRI